MSGAGSHLEAGQFLSIGKELGDSDATLNIGEGSSVAVSQELRLPSVFGNTASTGRGTININGAATPGFLHALNIVFGENGLGVLNFNHTDNSGNYAFYAPITGPGTVNVTDSGITTLTRDYTYHGKTNVNAGVLRAGSTNSLSPTSDFAVASGGTLDTNTYSPTVKSLSNAGTVTMLAGGTGSVLTVTGNYVGNGGVIAMNTIVGADNSATEKLVVNGATNGTTILNITNLGGAGAPTTGNGILVVEVAGASNGVFSLPAPGHLEVGGFRYELVKIGNNWYLSNNERTEASPVEASVACTPSQLGGSAGLVATCTVSLSVPLGVDMPINLNLPANSPRYSSTCASPLVIAANATQASCTITAVAATNESDVMAELSIAPPSVADAYAVGGVPAQVQILGNGNSRPGAGAHAVPTMGTVGLVAMASLMGLIGLRRSRKHNGRQG
ncbi:autotransporter outer membrane beta-barrel domain-containing protein [Comamonas piscis]|uniref:Autotransporter outer membrane beta-barrel domain-containing protein n=1 Tax=Comamonas piscis TaxID=1562974 RepID=A0A7G5EK49_9BURK|nr:autotransporter outer membrane beta-barrel domain-containing protein [Comamonas piscis]QMV74374.1 autotransporter outer membrane beta-barrel domain-containing protein [Comamonas piscis]WSO32823.1 autotransporter outer membrane beta-barrel domain-containing protein [Comamonas piscis]